jgi:hypothetical protein
MQPATDQPGGSNALRRWGPIAAIVVVAIIVGIVVVAGGGDDDKKTDEATSGGDTPTEVTSDDGEVVYPLSFSDAQEAGLDDLDFGDRCDPETGLIAVPEVNADECYLPFEGDNGGATAQGVTADTIKIVVYQGPDEDPVINYVTDAIQVDDTNADVQDTLNRLITYYETYHETYGRKIEIEYYVSNGIATDATTARADAVKIAEDLKPFQVWGGDELAARQIQCLGCAGGDQEEFEERAPYDFGLALTSEQARAHNVEALAKQVAGRNAEFAGDPEMQSKERVFGYLYIEVDEDSARNAQRYVDALAEEGVEIVEQVPYALDPATLQETAANAIAKLKQAGVTTVIFAGDPVAPRDFTNEATAQEYFPEWFLNLSTLVDTNVFARTYDQEQWKHAFGLTALAARVDPEVAGSQYIYEWFFGETPKADGVIGVVTPNPGLFFAVLQEVGPNLTNEAFRDAIFRLEPTPSKLTVPSLSWGQHDRWPTVEGDDYQGIDDVAKIWWDPTVSGADEIRQEGQGLWRYVDGGARYLSGAWPDEEFKAFDPEGTTTIYSEAPAAERSPAYEPLPPVREPQP